MDYIDIIRANWEQFGIANSERPLSAGGKNNKVNGASADIVGVRLACALANRKLGAPSKFQAAEAAE